MILSNDWDIFIASEMKEDYFKKLTQFLLEDARTHKIHPKHKNVFNAFTFCPLNKTKVIIIGQDPYHGHNQAHGLSFSVPLGEAPPPSLKNIFKEIKSDIGVTEFKHGCLQQWSEQGVLLLNSVLTVRENQAGSHRNKGWEIFTDNAIRLLNKLDQPIVFLLWGTFAKSKKELITNQNHLVLESSHPSPLSAHTGFFGCKHFSSANAFLVKNNCQPINWNVF